MSSVENYRQSEPRTRFNPINPIVLNQFEATTGTADIISKGRAIRAIRTSSPPELTQRVTFDVGPHGKLSTLPKFIRRQIRHGKHVDTRVNGCGQRTFDCPVTYFRGPEDLDKIRRVGDHLVEIVDLDGKTIVLDETPGTVDTFITRPSIRTKMEGFTNFEGPRMIGLGGGIRLQLDGFSKELQMSYQENPEGGLKLMPDRSIPNPPKFTFQAVVLFDDAGPRLTDLSGAADNVPQYVTDISLTLRDGRFYYEPDRPILSLSECIKSKSVKAYVDHLIHGFVEQEPNLRKLFGTLMAVDPAYGEHSIEIRYSALRENLLRRLITKKKHKELFCVIDIDGFDSIGVFHPPDRPDIVVDLLDGQARVTGLIDNELPQISIVTNWAKRIMNRLDNILGSKLITDEMADLIESHMVVKFIQPETLSEDDPNRIPFVDAGFTRELTGPVALGRLMDSLKITWQSTDTDGIFILEKGENTFIKVDVDGFTMAFWLKKIGSANINDQVINAQSEEEGYSITQLQDTSDLRKIKADLSQILEKDILEVHLGNLREGD